ncbi:hypothetical protein QN277_009418 [Acacia crassicarpa]|uniref:Uncharacterized protein n=1 Tax=Acacia crassicarpa TaxID=499986 RepID=A0AAE1IR52_9FABA|nr:hypothetical protein QN277_009418 [Acacia crassicarpa]
MGHIYSNFRSLIYQIVQHHGFVAVTFRVFSLSQELYSEADNRSPTIRGLSFCHQDNKPLACFSCPHQKVAEKKAKKL